MHRPLSRPLSSLFSRHRTSGTCTVIFLVCLFILSACGGNNASPNTTSNQPKKGGNLSVGLIAEPTILDPLTSVSAYDADIMVNIYDTLFKYDLHNTIQPELVSSYNYTSPTVLNLMLRSGVTFHDGTPFNADAVIFNLNRFLNDKTSPRYTDVVNIASVQKVGDLQVHILLKQPFAPLLNVLTGSVGMMLSPAVIQKLGKGLGNAPVSAGSGPFMFVEWIKGDHLLLKANPHFWQKDAQGNSLPYLQSIRYRTITNGTVMYTNLETAQIQVASAIDPNEVAAAKSNPSLIYRQVPGPGFASLFINNAAPPMNNVHVRRAIAWGINRQEILDHVFQGIGSVAQGPLSPVSWAYNKNISAYTYDPAKAKAELAQSGLTNVSFTLLTQSGTPTALQEAQFIQSELQPIGINVTIKQETFTADVTDLQTFHYQVEALGWTGSLDPDGSTYPLFTTTGGFNYTKYSNPQVDTLLNAARTATDQAQRITDYQQAEQLIVQDVPFVFIYYPAVYQATTSNVKNYSLYPNGPIDFTSVYLAS